jgi:hypothetical protein
MNLRMKLCALTVITAATVFLASVPAKAAGSRTDCVQNCINQFEQCVQNCHGDGNCSTQCSNEQEICIHDCGE